MSKRKPGAIWRFLAHSADGATSYHIENAESHRRALRWWRREMRDAPYPIPDVQVVPGDSIFDELVIDDWFHIEQMDTRLWWMRIGNGDQEMVVWVSIPARGAPIVTVQE